MPNGNTAGAERQYRAMDGAVQNRDTEGANRRDYSLDRIYNVRLALGVCEGRVIEVYRVAGWFYAGEVMRQDEGFVSADGRIEFVGNLASEALRRRYKDRLVTDLFHGQNPIKYVGDA